MLNTKEHFNQLDAIAVTELDNETAAAIGGGAGLEVFRDINGKDRIGSFNVGTPQVKANDQISSAKINDGGTWRFYEDANYKGHYIDVSAPKGVVINFIRPSQPDDFWNDRISSLKKISNKPI
ncbi:hypothetical protein [Nostoc sp. ChiQUE01b]|uniref:hypothetical protein n=1 Tax=Nostoc sp. ChiQUE01b TaxID=3075376 RepID=UPI002AD1E23F|nr:hypothetical protein [Nostoc sp. ChiQUE01b]MDZ8238731.1 hypothetical protein [Nostoc sp. ChiQUE01a]MDZ8263575.1 hypothetical protein [Nostoc sp. ChiQUE01b]